MNKLNIKRLIQNEVRRAVRYEVGKSFKKLRLVLEKLVDQEEFVDETDIVPPDENDTVPPPSDFPEEDDC